MTTESLRKSQKEWLKDLVDKVYVFRSIMKELKQAQDRKDEQKVSTLSQEREDIYAEIDPIINKGSSVGLSTDQVIVINLKIVSLISERKEVKEIILLLEKELIQILKEKKSE